MLRRAMTAMGLLFATVLYVSLSWATGPLPPPGEYAVDPAASSVGFNVGHLGIASVDGKFKTFTGHVTVGDSLATSHLDATVDVGSVDTGIGMRDKDIKAPDFFDVARFPTMTFRSTMLWGTPDNFGIKGNLTIKGVTKEVVFTARIQDGGVVLAQTSIDRTDFGVSGGSTIKNEVKLRLQIRLTPRPAPPP